MTTTRVDFLDDVQQIASRLALPSVILRISGDALPSFDEGSIVPVAIQHDPLPVGQLIKVVLRDLLGDDEVGRTDLTSHLGFQLNKAAK